MSANPVIDVDELNVRYGDFHAVKDLSFQVEPGELYALLGTNGAGKTSALEVVEGHRTASSGTVRASKLTLRGWSVDWRRSEEREARSGRCEGLGEVMRRWASKCA